MKHVGGEQDPFAANNDAFKADNSKMEPIKNLSEVLGEVAPELMDAMINDNAVDLTQDDDKGPAFPDPPDTMSLHTKEFYDKQAGFQPAIEHPDSPASQRRPISRISNKVATPATEIDLENLNESMIMDMPEIKAASFKIIDMLDPKPKDKSIRFRWANCKNHVAGNLGKYLAIGFQVAQLDDVDQVRTPIDPSMVDGTQVKYYDVLLLKINVIKLMELYKTNILKSISKLVKAKEKGLAEANRQFQSDISATPGASAQLSKYRQALGHEPVEFYATE